MVFRTFEDATPRNFQHMMGNKLDIGPTLLITLLFLASSWRHRNNSLDCMYGTLNSHIYGGSWLGKFYRNGKEIWSACDLISHEIKITPIMSDSRQRKDILSL